jgi:ferredoxin
LTYVVTENCIRCKYMGCIEVCRVDRFYAGENMLVITPVSALIAACENRSARPKAIVPDSGERGSAWADTNAS